MTGITAINIDISEKLAEVFPIYIAIIVVLSLLILLVVFRSILIPIKATAGFLFSIMATFGATTAVFQWGWFGSLFGIDTGGPLLSFIPIMVTGYPVRARNGLPGIPRVFDARSLYPW